MALRLGSRLRCCVPEAGQDLLSPSCSLACGHSALVVLLEPPEEELSAWVQSHGVMKPPVFLFWEDLAFLLLSGLPFLLLKGTAKPGDPGCCCP